VLMPYGKQSDVALSDTGFFNAYIEVSYLEEARRLSLGRTSSSSLDLMMHRVGHLRNKKYQFTPQIVISCILAQLRTANGPFFFFPRDQRRLA